VLLEAGALPDEPCGFMQTTPLSYAAQDGYRGVVEALIAAGADAERPDFYGSTPIDYGSFKPRYRLIATRPDQAHMGGRVG